jgi:outer membrane murein-binding lipoprotein Lpp
MTRKQWPLAAAVVLAFAAGCSKPAEAELARSRAEIEDLRADVARLRAQHNELQAEVEQLRLARRAPAGAAGPVKAAGDLGARLDAARAITSPSEQQRVYAALALEAATVGDVDTVHKCLENLTSPSARQDATYRCAIRLAAAGRASDGVALAKALTSPSQQQTTLAKIADGDFKE